MIGGRKAHSPMGRPAPPSRRESRSRSALSMPISGPSGRASGPGRLVKIIGTSTCDIAVWPNSEPLADIPGLCGIVDGSVLPGCFGLEAGQSAVGDIFNWFVEHHPARRPGQRIAHKRLRRGRPSSGPASPGSWPSTGTTATGPSSSTSGLTGLLLGQTLHTTPAEIYRALIEATAFGALTIINRFEEYGVKISEIINCGGIAEKNALLMQIYADVTGREMKIARSGADLRPRARPSRRPWSPGSPEEGMTSFEAAQAAMCGIKPRSFRPNRTNHRVYRELYRLYAQLHDAFGTAVGSGSLLQRDEGPPGDPRPAEEGAADARRAQRAGLESQPGPDPVRPGHAHLRQRQRAGQEKGRHGHQAQRHLL